MRAAVVFLSLLTLSGCSERPPPPTAPLAAGTPEEAEVRVRSFLDAYKRGDTESAMAHLCEPDAGTRAFLERSLAPGSPFRIDSYDIASVTPLWQRKQPVFLVMVRLPRRSAEPFEHGYRVRAALGCIDRLFGDPEPPAPSSRPALVPEGVWDPQEERVDDDETWGPPLPAAPTNPGDEIIDL